MCSVISRQQTFVSYYRCVWWHTSALDESDSFHFISVVLLLSLWLPCIARERNVNLLCRRAVDSHLRLYAWPAPLDQHPGNSLLWYLVQVLRHLFLLKVALWSCQAPQDIVCRIGKMLIDRARLVLGL